jgi:hypothetical protein
VNIIVVAFVVVMIVVEIFYQSNESEVLSVTCTLENQLLTYLLHGAESFLRS